ncbi:hypothetical protein [Lachnoclostridium phytofermentans]|uniref:hypothetical protein n=1 Tax=Lachnoclostridium phytofermentans TaxID=66219 RepID=UPI00049600B2|nr:hypothetical protein [Lachnoclostridium phytofermentans]
MNRYTYCANNPIRYYDPTGHRLKGDEDLLNIQGLAMVDFYASEWKKYQKLAKEVKNKDPNLYNQYKDAMSQVKGLANDVRTSQLLIREILFLQLIKVIRIQLTLELLINKVRAN